MSDVVLTVGGHSFEGWKSLRVTRSMESLANSFNFTLKDQADIDPQFRALSGASCVLTIEGESLITGYIDGDTISYDRSGNLSIGGRSKTCDLIDCSADQPGQFTNMDILQMANTVCNPFDIGVLSEVSTGAIFPRFGLQYGETPYEVLERASKMRSLLMYTNTDGDLVFTRAAPVASTSRISTSLEYGKNIESASRTNDWKDRYSTYKLIGQSQGSDTIDAGSAAQMMAESVDQAVTRYRPKIIQVDSSPTMSALNSRANWERNVRAGRSQKVQITVNGWFHSDGLWDINRLVPVIDPRLGINAELLIVDLEFMKTGEGTFTNLGLMAKEAFSIQDLPTPTTKQSATGLADSLMGA